MNELFLRILIALVLLGICGTAGLVMILYPGWGSRVGDNSLITFLYETVPEPWNRRIVVGFGMLTLQLALLAALFILLGNSF